jgi:hypothetical protein
MPFWRRGSPSPHRTHSLREYNNYLATLAYLLSLNLFAFPLLKYEKKLASTSTVRGQLEDLYRLVRKDAVLEDADVSVFRDSQWDDVPWSKVEGYI